MKIQIKKTVSNGSLLCFYGIYVEATNCASKMNSC